MRSWPGLVPRYADAELGLARLALLLPSGRRGADDDRGPLSAIPVQAC
jgi:hypothetical protein